MNDDDRDARTIHCGNLYAEKITEELLYELFLQAGPVERVSIPKDNGKNRQYGFVTYKYQVSVPYAMEIFAGTKLFNRDLRLNNRNANKSNGNDASHSRGQMESRSNIPHQYQINNPFGNASLRGASDSRNLPSMNPKSMSLMGPAPAPAQSNSMDPMAAFDYQTLLAFSAQMLTNPNGLGLAADNNESHNYQSKMTHRQENRAHTQNANYSRDRDRRNDGRNDRRSNSRERKDWMHHRRDNRSDRRNRSDNGSDRNRKGRYF